MAHVLFCFLSAPLRSFCDGQLLLSLAFTQDPAWPVGDPQTELCKLTLQDGWMAPGVLA